MTNAVSSSLCFGEGLSNTLEKMTSDQMATKPLTLLLPSPKPCKTAFEGSQQHVQISKVEINVCLLVNREESGVSLKFEEQSEGLSLLCSTGPVAAKVLLPKAWHQSCQRHCRGHLHHRHQRFGLFEQLTCLLAVWHGARLSS